jgi:hypothetical protein
MGRLAGETLMESVSYAELLGRLADALKEWANRLPLNRYADSSEVDYSFNSSIEGAYQNLLIRLGAERRGTLMEPINAALSRVKEKGKEFAAACRGIFPTQGAWEDVPLMKIDYMDPEYSNEFRWATEDICVELYKCDKLFEAIAQAIPKTESPGIDDDNNYKNRFEPVGFLPKELRKKLGGISKPTLRTYAKNAGISLLPKKGGKNFRYLFKDVVKICSYIISNVGDTDVVEAARKLFAEIEIKSKVEA